MLPFVASCAPGEHYPKAAAPSCGREIPERLVAAVFRRAWVPEARETSHLLT